jgi:hypothetical protein
MTGFYLTRLGVYMWQSSVPREVAQRGQTMFFGTARPLCAVEVSCHGRRITQLQIIIYLCRP